MTTEEMMDRQFVPDTIAVPVEWLKKLIELVDAAPMQEYTYEEEYDNVPEWCEVQEHIDLIREKL